MDVDLTVLTEDEQLALLGLLKLVVRADRKYSEEESDALHEIAQAMGGNWQDAVEKARVEIKTSQDALAVADRVARPEARAIVYRVLYDVAASDEIVVEEARILGWLASEWGFDKPAEEAAEAGDEAASDEAASDEAASDEAAGDPEA